jgi:uncharacterized protein
MDGIWRLRATVLTLAGVLAVHQGRYLFCTATREHELAAVHRYLLWLIPAVGVLLFLAAAQFLARLGREGAGAALPTGRVLWLLTSGVLLGAFIGQESLEEVFAEGHLPAAIDLASGGGWTAIGVLPAGVASAHVTLQPNEAPAGTFKRLDVRVPNERDDASTTKVQVKFPPGMARLAQPVEAFGEQHDEQVDTVTFTARGKGIAPGQFQDFGLSVGVPDKPNTRLTFKALQTYSSGETVRWIGAPDADTPAPQVKLTADTSDPAMASHGSSSGTAATPTAAASSGADDDGSGTSTVSVIALIVGGLGLVAGLAGVAAARRPRTA